MLCQKCGTREANVHVTQIINGKSHETSLCFLCAKESGIGPAGISLQSVLSSLIGHDALTSARCPECGLDASEFKRLGRVGCAKCYEAFSKEIAGVIRSTQAGPAHTGRRPDSEEYQRARELREKRAELSRAVEQERYEEAALLRDRIRELESSAPNGNGGAL